MTEHVPDMEYQSHHHFISHSPWDDQPARDITIGRADQAMGGDPDACLIIDETAFTKKGRYSVGVARQWSGQLGKVENCQVAVCGLMADKQDGVLIDCRLYLPKVWTQDPRRCFKAGIPEEEQAYKSKTTLALEIVENMDRNQLRYQWILADGGYGKEPKFLYALNAAGKKFVIDIHKSQHVFNAEPFKDVAPEMEPKKLRRCPKAQTVEAFVKNIDESEWQWVTKEVGAKGPKRVKALSRRIWVWDKGSEQAHQWSLIVTRKGDGKPEDEHKYSLCNANEKLPLQKLAWLQGHRFKIEQAFQEAKQELGMDDYQVRSWRGFNHHMTLIMMANMFLVEVKKDHREELEFFTLRDAREMIVARLPTLKGDLEMVMEQIKRRHVQRRRDLKRGGRRE